ncbi:probable E3 ubiquitin-protein ligase TRIML1 [Xyrauchen texanus]|uniref:probable E3 ubiquitin-protein ligase TRIML1 n=1 Tax=Xyrauchen texanus TaxID=154827 RepID=UPI002241D1C9|nr:probable E3 ubiquitin-protein ligase TRIML1 [Xyrauchen texanus]
MMREFSILGKLFLIFSVCLFVFSYFTLCSHAMESTISLLSEKHFLCSLCEEIFSNPVTTPCGHSFCKMCLRVYWGRSGSDECPLCKRTFGSRPHLSVNHILEDVTENYRKTRLTAKSKFFSMDELQDEPKNTGEVEQMIQERLQKVEKFQSSLKLLKEENNTEMEQHEGE